MAQVSCSLNSGEQNAALLVNISQEETPLIIWRLIAYFCSAQGQSHFPYLLGYKLLKWASNKNYWHINFSTSKRLWQSICVTEGDSYRLPTCAYLLDMTETVNTGKAELGVKIQKYLGQSSKCILLWLLCHTAEFSWLNQLLSLLPATAYILGNVFWAA